MTGRRFCLDTSGFLDGFVRYYPPETFQTLWDRMDALASSGRVVVPEEVYLELEHHHDAAFQWLNDRKEQVLVSTDALVVAATRELLTEYPRLAMEGSTRNRADPFVIATASLQKACVVTGESGGTEKSPKIPYVCGDQGIECLNFLAVVQLEAWSF